jgi:hypothetical protein
MIQRRSVELVHFGGQFAQRRVLARLGHELDGMTGGPHYGSAVLSAQVTTLLKSFSARPGLAVDWPLGHRRGGAKARPRS